MRKKNAEKELVIVTYKVKIADFDEARLATGTD
jgi:hypothetical protein